MARKTASISFIILEIIYSIEESLDRFGIAPDFDDPGLFDFVEMVIIGNIRSSLAKSSAGLSRR